MDEPDGEGSDGGGSDGKGPDRERPDGDAPDGEEPAAGPGGVTPLDPEELAEVWQPPAGQRLVVQLDARSFVGIGLAAAGALLIHAIATSASEMVTRIAVGVLLGVALSPLVVGLQRRFGWSRSSAAAVVGAGMAAIFAVVLLLVGPPAVRQLETFSGDVPDTVEEMYSWPFIGDRLEEADARETVEEWIDDLPARLDEETIADFADRLLGGLVTTAIVLLTTLGVLIDGERTVRRVRMVMPSRLRPRADRIGHVLYETFGSYFAGSLLVAALNGTVILTTGLVLGVPLAPIAALWAMLTNLIPQVGGFLGGSFFVLLALTESPAKALVAGVVFLGYQQFENNVVGPAVVGNAVNLSPPTTMLAALVGGAAAGVPGALVATPLLGAAKAVYLERRGVVRQREPAAISRARRRRGGPAPSG